MFITRWARLDHYVQKQSSEGSQPCNFIKKESLAQVFSCEFCEVSKNTFFTEQLRWLLLYVMCRSCWSRVATESWESWKSWEIEQTVRESHGFFFFFETSWEMHWIFISCILENLIWLLLNTLLEVFVAKSIKLTLFTYKD